jgi:hypothetical protein
MFDELRDRPQANTSQLNHKNIVQQSFDIKNSDYIADILSHRRDNEEE